MLSVWSLRRVLLAGSPCAMLSAMETLLHAAGARIQHAHMPLCEEALSRQLHEGRYACVIVPDLLMLVPGSPQACLSALDLLLGEIRESGVPLAMLLTPASPPDTAQLLSHAIGWSQGTFGDPVSLLCVRHTGEHIQAVCHEALILGARFLAGEQGCTGLFTAASRNGMLAIPPQPPPGIFVP